jgi:uncharacterized protein with ParB-like and HNH nuclease domain
MSHPNPHYRTIAQLLKERSFTIDEYQREYKWEQKQIEELINDLRQKFLGSYRAEHATTETANYADYFLGSIIVTENNALVDGQQRLSSLTLLLIYLYHAAKDQGLDVANTMRPLIYADINGAYQFNLHVPERLPIIEALFNKDEDFPLEGKPESIQNIGARYRNIEGSDLVKDLGIGLPHFIYWLMNRVGVIEIVTGTESDAYAIFETMNDRGKPLNPVDMLKAYLLAPIPDEARRQNANRTWKQTIQKLISAGDEVDVERDSSMIKAWLRAQYADAIRVRTADASDKDWELIGKPFHRWVRDNEKRLGWGSENRHLEVIQSEFPFFASAYLQIQEASTHYTPGLEAVFYNAHNEFTWQNTVLLAPLSKMDNGDTVRRKLAATAIYLDIWIMRRVVNYIRVGYSSTSYTMYNLCRDIRSKSLPELVEILTQKLALDAKDVSFDGSPSRERNGIDELYLNQFTRRYIYHLLGRLMVFVETQSGMPDLFDKYMERSSKNPLDIEHICPFDYARYQGEFASAHEFYEWRDHVAGLLLLPADVNRSYQAKTFEEKAPHYAKQNLYAASLTASAYQHQPKFLAFRNSSGLPFEPFEHFGKTEQMKRRELIHALVHQVWSPDRLQAALQ